MWCAGIVGCGEYSKKYADKYKAGNACIHLERLADIDLPTLKKLIRRSVDSVAEE
jgi:hypothetical protein